MPQWSSYEYARALCNVYLEYYSREHQAIKGAGRSLVKQQPPILGLPTEISFFRLSQRMDPDFTRGEGRSDLSKTTGYQEGCWVNLFPVWMGNNCTRASFWCLNWVFLTQNQIHFLNGIFFFNQGNAVRKKKKCEAAELLTFAILRAHLCGAALWQEDPTAHTEPQGGDCSGYDPGVCGKI